MYMTYLNDENIQRVKWLMALWSMTIYSETVHQSESTLAHDLVSKANLVSDVDNYYRIPRYSMEYLQRVCHATIGTYSSGHLVPICPFWNLYMIYCCDQSFRTCCVLGIGNIPLYFCLPHSQVGLPAYYIYNLAHPFCPRRWK